jgi:hypothetical protein
MKKVTFATVEAWKECSKEMDKLGISYESGNEKDLTCTIHAGEERFNDIIDNCENAFNPYEDYPK